MSGRQQKVINLLQTKIAKKKRENLSYEMQKVLFFARCTQNFWENKNASHRTRTFRTLSDGKLHCFRNNTGIRINISSLSASTLIRECVFFSFCCFDIPKLKAIAIFRSRVLASKFLPFLLPPTRKESERKNFVKSKQKTLILKQKFGIKCQQSEKHIIWLISHNLSVEADETFWDS